MLNHFVVVSDFGEDENECVGSIITDGLFELLVFSAAGIVLNSRLMISGLSDFTV